MLVDESTRDKFSPEDFVHDPAVLAEFFMANGEGRVCADDARGLALFYRNQAAAMIKAIDLFVLGAYDPDVDQRHNRHHCLGGSYSPFSKVQKYKSVDEHLDSLRQRIIDNGCYFACNPSAKEPYFYLLRRSLEEHVDEFDRHLEQAKSMPDADLADRLNTAVHTFMPVYKTSKSAVVPVLERA